MCGSSRMQPAARGGGHKARLESQLTGVPIQKCPELVPASPPGAYDGRAKWAAALVIGGSFCADSVTTPPSGDEAQAESSHAITNASIPDHAERLFTKPNLPVAESH